MKPEDKVSLSLIIIFVVLLLSLVWTSDSQSDTKVETSLAIVLLALLMEGTILWIQKRKENTTLAYTVGLLTFLVGYAAWGYALFGRINMPSLMAGIAFGSVVIALKRWGEVK